MEYSQDKARAGGLLGLKVGLCFVCLDALTRPSQQKTDLVEPISSTAFNLPVNQPSDPVKSEFGYHILLVEARK